MEIIMVGGINTGDKHWYWINKTNTTPNNCMGDFESKESPVVQR